MQRLKFMISKAHINGLIIDVSKLLLRQGELSSPRGHKTLEIMNPMLCLTDPKNSICTITKRNLSRKYLNAELDWYRSGELNIDKIKPFSSMWPKLADEFGYVNSNYGYWAKHHETEYGLTQFHWCVEELSNDHYSRRAIITYNQREHQYRGVKDFPCTMYQQFYIRKGKLNSFVSMRSNDLIYGFCYDVPYFTLLQKELAQKLCIPIGKYYHHAVSMHVYERHFDMINEIAKEG